MKVKYLFFMLLGIIFILLNSQVITAYSIQKQRALIVLSSDDIAQTKETKQFIEQFGHITQVFPPHYMIGDIDVDKLENLTRNKNILEVFTGKVDSDVIEIYDKNTEIVLSYWNIAFEPKLFSAKKLDSESNREPKPILNDVVWVPLDIWEDKSITQQSNKIFSAPDYWETSEYLYGQVLVSIILPESNGAIDSSTEDWTTTEKNKVISEIIDGLTWWESKAPLNVDLTIWYITDYDVPTSYEPISRSRSDNGLWIGEIMDSWGYSGPTYYNKVYAYDNDLREIYSTDWAYTVFVVDSSNDADGKFSDGYFAFATCIVGRTSCPFMTMTSTNDGYGTNNMDAVMAHETGHIFGAGDQYASSGCTCTSTYGFLDVENQNCENSCLSNVASIMRGQIAPYTSGSIDYYAKGQIGWRDLNSNGIIDVIDSAYNTDTDTDHDGIVDYWDSDIDGDGVLNQNDDCPTIVGMVQYNGCPDTFPPNITIFSPTNGTYYNSSSVYTNVYAGETAKWIKEYLNNNQIFTYNNISAVSWSLFLSDGIYDFVVSASDFYDNIGNKSIQFIVDTIKPVINSINTNNQPNIPGRQIIVGGNLTFSASYNESNLNYISAFCAYNSSDPTTYRSVIDYNVSSGSNKIWNWTLNLLSLPDNSTIDDCQVCLIDKAKNSACWFHIGDYIIDKCLPAPVQINDSCGLEDSFALWYNDTNNCYAQTGTDSDKVPENQTISCNYCNENISEPFNSPWGNCINEDTQNRTKYFIDTNFNSCCAVTGSSSDCSILNSTYQNKTEYQTCDYCTPNWTANSICNPEDSETIWYNDTNSCFEKTGLSADSHNPDNQTSLLSCDYNKDGIIGGVSDLNTTITGIDINLSTNVLEFKIGNSPLISFEFNLTNSPLNFANIFIEKQPANSSFAYMIIKGLDLTSQNRTKTVYLNSILNGTGICIKDSELTSINELSDSCTGSNEFWLKCPSANGDYLCNMTENNTIYQISGLKHSGVKEQANYCGDGICNGGESCSSCLSDCGVCPSAPVGSSSGGGGRGGGGGSSTPKNIIVMQSSPQNTSQNNNDNTNNTLNLNNRAPITGAVIGAFGTGGSIVALIFVVVIIAVATWFGISKRRKKKGSKKKKMSKKKVKRKK